MSAFGRNADIGLMFLLREKWTKNRWDNFKNTLWNSMERLSGVGHANVLKGAGSSTLPLGTILTLSLLIVIARSEATQQSTLQIAGLLRSQRPAP
jgi:hypothetical protein